MHYDMPTPLERYLKDSQCLTTVYYDASAIPDALKTPPADSRHGKVRMLQVLQSLTYRPASSRFNNEWECLEYSSNAHA